MESEERGNGWSEGVPEGGAGVGFGSATATSPEKAITLHGGSLIESNDKTALRGRLDRCNAVFGQYFDVGFAGGLAQTVEDGLGSVGDGKHSPIRFGFKSDTAGVKPFYRLGGAEACEGTNQGATASGVAGGEFAGVETGVSDIAATSS